MGGGCCSQPIWWRNVLPIAKYACSMRGAASQGFGLNSSNQRRAVDVVSPHSDHLARDRQKTHNWPAGNLFLCLPDPRPENSTENSGGVLARVANFLSKTSAAPRLCGRVSLSTP